MKRTGNALEIIEILSPQAREAYLAMSRKERDLDASRDLRGLQGHYRFMRETYGASEDACSELPDLPVPRVSMALDMETGFFPARHGHHVSDICQISNRVIREEMHKKAKKKEEAEEAAQSRITQLLVGVSVYKAVKAKTKVVPKKKKKKKKT